jgi:hypothetical protein
MKYLLIALAVFASGCSTTVPVTAKFPDAPKHTEACPQLQKLADAPKLSDVSTTVNTNYTAYYECAVKNDKWNEWYAIQKKIFEGVAK